MTAHISTACPMPAQPDRKRGFFRCIAAFRALARSRGALERLTDAQLNDIGVTRAEAMKEAERAPWDAPRHWFD